MKTMNLKFQGMKPVVLGPLPEGLGRTKPKPVDSFQNQVQEVHLQVTPSMLHSTAFQRKLADYSTRGIPVQVALVPEEPVAKAAAPPAPAPAQPSRPIPTPDKGIGATGVVSALAAAVMGSLGGILLYSLMTKGLGPVQEGLLQHGLCALMPNDLSNLPAYLMAGFTNAACASGALKVKAKVEELASRLRKGATPTPAAPQPGRKLTRKGLALATSVASLGALQGMAGGLLGGLTLATAGHPFVSSLDLSQLANPAVLAAAATTAAVVGVMGCVGGWELGKNFANSARW